MAVEPVAGSVCRLAPWSWQNDRTKARGLYNEGPLSELEAPKAGEEAPKAGEEAPKAGEEAHSIQDLTGSHEKTAVVLNLAIGLSSIPVIHLLAAGIFVMAASTMENSVEGKAFKNHLIGMAITTAVVGFVPFAMPIVFGIGTAVQYFIICRPEDAQAAQE